MPYFREITVIQRMPFQLLFGETNTRSYINKCGIMAFYVSTIAHSLYYYFSFPLDFLANFASRDSEPVVVLSVKSQTAGLIGACFAVFSAQYCAGDWSFMPLCNCLAACRSGSYNLVYCSSFTNHVFSLAYGIMDTTGIFAFCITVGKTAGFIPQLSASSGAQNRSSFLYHLLCLLMPL